jgi:hypothetical protein
LSLLGGLIASQDDTILNLFLLVPRCHAAEDDVQQRVRHQHDKMANDLKS